MVLWFNAHYTPFWNTFFKYFTHLGDGLVFVPLCLSLLWVRYGYAAIAAITGVVLALLSNIFKHLVFSDFSRPKAWFAEAGLLQFVEGVTIHSRNAFPSGHTATAAAVAILLALFIRNRYATAGLLLYALLVAMSRVYLAQHFFQDVVFGFLEGAAAGALVYHIAAKFWKGA